MFFPILYLVVAFAALYIGAEWLVKGSSQLARATGIKPVVIALTIVAFGTSAPELVVSVNASIHHTSNIAIGNILGSMIANMALVLGLAAMIKPIKIEFRLIRKEIPILLVCEFLFLGLAWNLYLSRLDGMILLVGFAIFNWYYLREALKNIKDEKKRVQKEYEEYVSNGARSKVMNIALIIVGIAALLAGSHYVIKGVTEIAQIFGISAFVISASIVAFGTSIPELATSVVAAARGEFDISVGNILGSNIFNVLMCIGAASAANPLTVEANFIRHDAIMMIGLSILLGIIMWTKMKISRIEGIILLLIYGGYIYYLYH
jgi:cation:H+ antiporter